MLLVNLKNTFRLELSWNRLKITGSHMVQKLFGFIKNWSEFDEIFVFKKPVHGNGGIFNNSMEFAELQIKPVNLLQQILIVSFWTTPLPPEWHRPLMLILLLTFKFTVRIFTDMNIVHNIRGHSNFGNVSIVVCIWLFATEQSLKTLKWRHLAVFTFLFLVLCNQNLLCWEGGRDKYIMDSARLIDMLAESMPPPRLACVSRAKIEYIFNYLGHRTKHFAMRNHFHLFRFYNLQ